MPDCSPAVPFSELRSEPFRWITVYEAKFYPDKLDAAIVRYEPILERFSELVEGAESSADLLRLIMDEPRILRSDLLKLFTRYVSPTTKTELLKKKSHTERTIHHLGDGFRSLEIVERHLATRPAVDEAIIAILDEHSSRGRSGYQLTEDFFLWFETDFAELGWSIQGPRGAGRDINLPDLLDGFEKEMPVDFAIADPTGNLRVIGFARYDTDRGGSQEDDRISGNVDKLTEVMKFNRGRDLPLKVLYLNDGLGLTLGSMWRDYAEIEQAGGGISLVTTLKMAQAGRVSLAWLGS
jgi:hypothetical protein